VTDRAGRPAVDHDVTLSLLGTRPVTDVFYRERTDTNGECRAVFFPPRGVERSHVIAWAMIPTVRGAYPDWAADDLSVPVRGQTGRDPADYRLNIVRAPAPPVIDGQRDEAWDAADPLDLSWQPGGPPRIHVTGRWSGNDDLSGKIHCLWDTNALYVLGEIRDTEPAHNPWEGAELWKGDNLEFYLGREGPGSRPDGYLDTDYQFVLAPGGKTWVYGQAEQGTRNQPLRETDIAVRGRENGYVIEARVPWSNFSFSPRSGDDLRMEVSLTDYESGQAYPTKLFWATSGQAYATVRDWGRAVLAAGAGRSD
jgi:hypothetical protein